jgi:hypothetical protein
MCGSESVPGEIHSPHEVGHPCHIILSRGNLQLRETLQHPVEDKHRERAFDFMMQDGDLTGLTSAWTPSKS